MNKILLATCGTSVLTNARDVKKDVIGDRNYSEMTDEESRLIKEKVMTKLADKEPIARECGAELNSTYYLIKKGMYSKDMAYLIVSDSIEGILSGKIIKELMIEKLGIKKVEIKIIDKLNITKEHEFAKKGLRNLASSVAQIISKENRQDLMISPIGGLKAQIFIVGLLAQIFKIPAYYLYENSTEIIELLPLPIDLDIDFFRDNIEVISKIANEELVNKKDIDSYLKSVPDLRNIFEEEKIDGNTYVSLSVLGKIAYEKLMNDNINKLPRDAKSEEKLLEVQFKGNEAHADQVRTNQKCQNFLKTILEVSYVTKIIINYYNPKNEGDVKKITKSSNQIEGRVLSFTYNNKQGMLKGNIFITENDEHKVDAALIDLQNLISK